MNARKIERSNDTMDCDWTQRSAPDMNHLPSFAPPGGPVGKSKSLKTLQNIRSLRVVVVPVDPASPPGAYGDLPGRVATRGRETAEVHTRYAPRPTRRRNISWLP